MKKIFFITFLSTVLLWTVNVFVYYLFNYPQELNILEILKEYVEWKPLLQIYISLILISVIASFFILKKQIFLNKFCRILICINIIGILFMSINGIYRYAENKRNYDEILSEFLINAKKDIKNDNIKTFSFGLQLPPKNKTQEIEKTKSDSILKIYGITIKNLGCTIMPELTKATEEYNKVTEIYLTKRNGKGWRAKMRKELQKVNKNYR